MRLATAVRRLRVEVLASYAREPVFTQGLELRDGLLYESAGLVGHSALRVTHPVAGNVIQRVALPATAFGEGIAIVGDWIWQLTWHDGYAFGRDRATLAELTRVPFAGPGWGLCYDPSNHRLIMSDGSEHLTCLDPDSFEPVGRISVTHAGKPLTGINELAWVDGTVWANVFPTDYIVRIDLASGHVDTVVDARGLLTDADRAGRDIDVLNGITAVPETDAFLLTGKLWPTLYLVRFIPA